jgi:predicted aspartyl protease
MIDSGATTLFVNRRFVQRHHIICSLLPSTIALYNIDGSKNKAGSLTHFACLTLTIDSWNEPTDFLVTDLGPEDIILGLLWLKKVNPTIDWDSGKMEIPNSSEQFTPFPPHILEANCSEHQAWIKARIITDNSNEIETLKTKVYPMPINEQKTLNQFIQENLEKGYIVPSKSSMAPPVFFVKKKTGDLRLIQNYRKLNSITVKNFYPLPLAMDIVNKLQDAIIFIKFNIRWSYHSV